VLLLPAAGKRIKAKIEILFQKSNTMMIMRVNKDKAVFTYEHDDDDDDDDGWI